MSALTSLSRGESYVQVDLRVLHIEDMLHSHFWTDSIGKVQGTKLEADLVWSKLPRPDGLVVGDKEEVRGV